MQEYKLGVEQGCKLRRWMGMTAINKENVTIFRTVKSNNNKMSVERVSNIDEVRKEEDLMYHF